MTTSQVTEALAVTRWWLHTLIENGFLTRVLAGLGIVATPLGIVQFFDGNAADELSDATWLVLATAAALLILAVSLALSWPRTRIVRKFVGAHTTWSITIKTGDLFAETPIVVTADRKASTAEADVGPSSLVHQLMDEWFAGSEAALEGQVAGHRAAGARLPLGTTVPISSGTRRGWLFCLAEPSSTGPVTSWRDLVLGLDTLWATVRSSNLKSFAVPVIGSGYARAHLSHEGLICMLILSFHSANITHHVGANMTIVIDRDDYSPRSIAGAQRLLKALRFE